MTNTNDIDVDVVVSAFLCLEDKLVSDCIATVLDFGTVNGFTKWAREEIRDGVCEELKTVTKIEHFNAFLEPHRTAPELDGNAISSLSRESKLHFIVHFLDLRGEIDFTKLYCFMLFNIPIDNDRTFYKKLFDLKSNKEYLELINTADDHMLSENLMRLINWNKRIKMI